MPSLLPVMQITDRFYGAQAQTLPHSIQKNPLFERGYKGYTMLKKDGSSMAVKYDDVGNLANEMHARLKPLKDGPFGGAGQPPTKALHDMKMEISDGPLDKAEYTTIDAFVAAIDALPNPAV